LEWSLQVQDEAVAMVAKAMVDSVWVNGGGLFSDYVIEFTTAAKGAGTREHYDASLGHALTIPC
jgi:hypothetical protein